MILTPKTTTLIGDGLDHPEGVCIAPDGTIYASLDDNNDGCLFAVSESGEVQWRKTMDEVYINMRECREIGCEQLQNGIAPLCVKEKKDRQPKHQNS